MIFLFKKTSTTFLKNKHKCSAGKMRHKIVERKIDAKLLKEFDTNFL